MRPQRCMGHGEKCPHAQRKERSRIPLTFRSLVITSTISDETRGNRICGGFQSINAHAKQERSELSWTGNGSSIQKLHNGFHCQWRSANKWGSNSVGPRPWALRVGTNPWGHASSPVAGQTLRRTRICTLVDRWSETTFDQQWQKNPVQHGKPCTDRCPRIVNRFLQLECKYVFNFVTAGHVWWLFIKSSHNTKWQYKHSGIGKPVEIPQKPENTNKKEDPVPVQGDRLRDLPEWFEEFAESLEDEGVLASRDTFLRTQIRNVLQKWYRGSTISLLTSPKTDIAKSGCEPKMTRAPCRRRTGEAVPRTEKFWWLDHNRSQSLQRRKWIPEQSPTRSRGTRFCHSMDSILSVQNQNQNLSGDGKEFTKVSRAVGKAESHQYRQFCGIWQILWRFIMESLYINASPIRDEWCCWESGTQN